MIFRQVADPQLAQYAYLVGCERTREAILVDPERDVDRYLEIAAAENLRVTAVTETHIHADFLSGARELARRDPGVRLYLSGEGGEDWSYRWPDADARAWTKLRDGDRLEVGEVELRVLHTPGHTPEHLAFLLVDRGGGAGEPMALLAGDFVFVGDLGRPDLLETAAGEIGARGPSARRLHASARRLLELPEWLQVWPGHGAGSSCGKALGAMPSTTLGYERRHSPALAAVERGEAAFVEFILKGQPEPPPYFARMKRLNRDGAPVTGELSRPRRIDAAGVAEWIGRDGRSILDLRRDKRDFFAGHLKGALFTAYNRNFPTMVGSYVEPERELLLIVPESSLEAAVRSLSRIGFDRVAAWLPAEEIGAVAPAYREATDRIEFAQLPATVPDGAAVLDVRGAAEFESGHLAGAVNVPYTRLLPQLGSVPRDRPLLVHCNGGTRAAAASAFLAARGYAVRFVDGAIPRDRPLTSD